jgi:fructose-1-phosphate kinase PfkB-like protein
LVEKFKREDIRSRFDVLAVYPAGGYTGQYFNHLLAKENINVQIIETASETRENIIVLDEAANLQYRFGFNIFFWRNFLK